MDDRENITIQDEEFDKMLRDGLNTSYREDGLCVTEDLIARTMKAIEADAGKSDATIVRTGEQTSNLNDNIINSEDARRIKRNKFIKIAAGIAAAAFVGIIGIAVLGNGTRVSKSAPQSDMEATNSMKPMRAESKSAEKSAADISYAYDGAAPMANAECQEACDDADEAFDDMGCANGAFADETLDEVIEAYSNATPDNEEEPLDDKKCEDLRLESGCAYNLSGDEDAGLYEALYAEVIAACGDIVYELTGVVTDDIREKIPDDMGECILSVSYSGDDMRIRTIGVFEKYCEIHNAKPLSSASADYTSELYRVDDGAALAMRLQSILESAE